MEDAIQIVFFIIFFIFSILSSKNKNKKKKTNVPVQPAKTKQNKSSQTKTQQEIFEDLFGLKTEHDTQPVVIDTEPTTSSYKSWYAGDNYNKTNYDDASSFKEKVQKTKEQLEKEKLEHEALKQKIKSTHIVKQNKYQKLLLNSSTLKEFIIISEILNKPKALRRR